MTKSAELSNKQQLFMDLREKKPNPMSAYMILDQLRDSGFWAPLQIYRALEKLIGMGRVHRLESLNDFIACSHMSCEKGGATAFVICDRCENVQEVCDDSVSLFLDGLTQKAKFRASKPSIGPHGVCDACEGA